jgi:PAS domain-containing protein
MAACIIARLMGLARRCVRRVRRHRFAGAGITVLAVGFSASLYWFGRLAAAGAASNMAPVTVAVMAAGAGGLVWLSQRRLRRRRLAAAYNRRDFARLARRNALLQNTLDNIGEGLGVFDARARLVARNSRFCELLSLPLDLPVGTSLSQILLDQAKRGDFGDVDPNVETGRRRRAAHCRCTAARCRTGRWSRSIPM